MTQAMGANLDGYHDPRLDLERALLRRTAARLAAARAALADCEPERLQEKIRSLVLAGLGGPAAAPGALPAGGAPTVGAAPALAIEYGERLELPRYTVEKLVVRSLAGVRIPCNLYRPLGPAPQQGRPAVVVLCGHYASGKAHDDYQRAAGAFAASGYVVAVFDPHGLGERRSYQEIDPGTSEHTYAGIQCWWWGLSPARYFLDDARRVVDLLVSQPDVDNERIVALGSSGGGMLTTLAMALEPRLAGAAPATFVTSRTAYQQTGGVQDCEQILLGAGAGGLDHDWLLMSLAPKPVCVLAGESDFFPIEGTLETVAAARQFWDRLGAPENLALCRAASAHRLHPEMIDFALEFFNSRLGHHERAGSSQEVEVLPPERLNCSPEAHVGGAIIKDRLLQELPGPAEATGWLRSQVESDRKSAEPHVRRLPVGSGYHLLWQSEPGIWGCAVASGPTAERVLLTDLGTLEPAALPEGGLVLDVRGRGALAPLERHSDPRSQHHYASYRHLSELLWLGDSLAAGQVWDVLWALQHVAPEARELHGSGYGAYLARLVAFLKPLPLCLQDEYVSPDSVERLWDEGRGGWAGVIPGLARRWPAILAATDALRFQCDCAGRR